MQRAHGGEGSGMVILQPGNQGGGSRASAGARAGAECKRAGVPGPAGTDPTAGTLIFARNEIGML